SNAAEFPAAIASTSAESPCSAGASSGAAFTTLGIMPRRSRALLIPRTKSHHRWQFGHFCAFSHGRSARKKPEITQRVRLVTSTPATIAGMDRRFHVHRGDKNASVHRLDEQQQRAITHPIVHRQPRSIRELGSLTAWSTKWSHGV